MKSPATSPKLAKVLASNILSRYLKPDANRDISLEFMVLTQLFKKYPSTVFWLRHDLGFKLNSLFWFKSRDGSEKLAQDWQTFHFKFDKEDEIIEDKGYVAESIEIPAVKKKKMSEWLKS